MSSMLEQAIVDAKALKEAALKNAEQAVIDKYAPEIKAAVENTYNVSVSKVRTMNYGPERKVKYTKNGVQSGKTNAKKRAIVKVADGNAIDFYSNL